MRGLGGDEGWRMRGDWHVRDGSEDKGENRDAEEGGGEGRKKMEL